MSYYVLNIQCVMKKMVLRKLKVFLHNKQEMCCLLWSTYFYQLVYVSLKIFTKEKVLLTDLIFENFINYVTQGWRLKFTFYFTSDYAPTTFICQIKLHPKMSVYLCSIVNNLKKPKDTIILEHDRKTSVWSKVLYVTYQRINCGRNKDYLVINWLFYVNILQIQLMTTM